MRIFGGLLIGIVIAFIASGIHEGMHWLFIVPFDGSVADWHWLPNPGWDAVEISPDPWGTIALFAGGLTASLFLTVCLWCVIWRIRNMKNLFWWFLGIPLAFTAPLQFGAGILEGAANDIYANQSSLIGSIGVIYNGFGFVDTIHKLGIQRRLVTAGSHKGFMDPFSPMKPGEEKDLKNMQKEMLHKLKKQF